MIYDDIGPSIHKKKPLKGGVNINAKVSDSESMDEFAQFISAFKFSTFITRVDFNKYDAMYIMRRYKGRMSYNIDGKEYVNTLEFCKSATCTNEEQMLMVLKYGDKLPIFFKD